MKGDRQNETLPLLLSKPPILYKLSRQYLGIKLLSSENKYCNIKKNIGQSEWEGIGIRVVDTGSVGVDACVERVEWEQERRDQRCNPWKITPANYKESIRRVMNSKHLLWILKSIFPITAWLLSLFLFDLLVVVTAIVMVRAAGQVSCIVLSRSPGDGELLNRWRMAWTNCKEERTAMGIMK